MDKVGGAHFDGSGAVFLLEGTWQRHLATQGTGAQGGGLQMASRSTGEVGESTQSEGCFRGFTLTGLFTMMIFKM